MPFIHPGHAPPLFGVLIVLVVLVVLVVLLVLVLLLVLVPWRRRWHRPKSAVPPPQGPTVRGQAAAPGEAR